MRRWLAGCAVLCGLRSPLGNVAYALAKTTTTFTGPDGKPVVVPGKAATMWRKGADGRWSCVVDIWNDDVPPKP
jgi:ketosteroid isomerase-like protein